MLKKMNRKEGRLTGGVQLSEVLSLSVPGRGERKDTILQIALLFLGNM